MEDSWIWLLVVVKSFQVICNLWWGFSTVMSMSTLLWSSNRLMVSNILVLCILLLFSQWIIGMFIHQNETSIRYHSLWLSYVVHIHFPFPPWIVDSTNSQIGRFDGSWNLEFPWKEVTKLKGYCDGLVAVEAYSCCSLTFLDALNTYVSRSRIVCSLHFTHSHCANTHRYSSKYISYTHCANTHRYSLYTPCCSLILIIYTH